VTPITTPLTSCWAIEPHVFEGMIHVFSMLSGDDLRRLAETARAAASPTEIATNGDIAIIPIMGPITKGHSIFEDIFGGTSSVHTRNLLASAMADPRIGAVVLHIDSPGGTVAGSVDLAADVAAATKPVLAFVEDMAASAGLWIASQTDGIIATRTSEIGSIGVRTGLYDLSALFEKMGVRAVPISTAQHKSIGMPGAPITSEQVEVIRERIQPIHDLFVRDVAKGRGMSVKDVEALADGRIWIGADAVKLGLADRIGTVQDVIAEARARVGKKRRRGTWAHVLVLKETTTDAGTAAGPEVSVGGVPEEPAAPAVASYQQFIEAGATGEFAADDPDFLADTEEIDPKEVA
jgi:signal peptide peptidase SppA